MPDSDLSSAAMAVELWALTTRRYDRAHSRLSSDRPFPSSLYTALEGRDLPPSAQVRGLIGQLELLATAWQKWEAAQPEGVDG